ncbi:hypothetical protein MCOR02_011254 [Pyricularia oryzae]|uniref:Uncharacterized protein n=1 Tax=Pyricularia oryzae TaxID=318829 RepID=A0A4P7N6Z7_PYROR|nr:hypothetical protein MCOR02_011254 [Pyricularia oryzae]QBZ58447.1 hypothetical protein PoMZ_03400 [Pyricularia oryzae]
MRTKKLVIPPSCGNFRRKFVTRKLVNLGRMEAKALSNQRKLCQCYTVFARPFTLGKECLLALWHNRRRQAFPHRTEPELSLCDIKLFLHCRHRQFVEILIRALYDAG